MRTVWKCPLEPGLTELQFIDPKVVHVGIDPAGAENWPCIWVEHTVGLGNVEEPDGRSFFVIGTGHEVPHLWKHVGSVITEIGLVWHVYERDH